MKAYRKLTMVSAVVFGLAALAADLPPYLDDSDERVWTPLNVPFRRIGTLKPRRASEIRDSNWTLGCEGLDRWGDFRTFRDYIDPLGIKTIRLQAGWAKCEKEKGKYDFAWLDDIIDYAVTNGINVLLETDYGNTIYEGGGGPWLGSPFPTSEVAVVAWDNWVDALSKHYRGKVRDWAMWNEPDISIELFPGMRRQIERKSPESIAAQNVRTARIIRRNIPDARIGALSLAQNSPEFLEKCLVAMGEDVKLFEWVIYHGYVWNPDVSYADVEKQKEILKKYMPHARMRQGENGCNSGWVPTSALSSYPWSEFSQAKWDLRRMLGDLGHDIPSSVFCLHGGGDGKSLLRMVKNKVIDMKIAYYAVQNVASVFDDSLERIGEDTRIKTDFQQIDPTVATYEYRKRDGRRLYVLWEQGDLKKFNKKTNRQCPSDSFVWRPISFSITKELKEPVWVDLITGAVYEFPAKYVRDCGGLWHFRLLPVYDSPILLTERSVVLP